MYNSHIVLVRRSNLYSLSCTLAWFYALPYNSVRVLLWKRLCKLVKKKLFILCILKLLHSRVFTIMQWDLPCNGVAVQLIIAWNTGMRCFVYISETWDVCLFIVFLQEELKAQLRAGLASLPNPSNDFEIVLPEVHIRNMVHVTMQCYNNPSELIIMIAF